MKLGIECFLENLDILNQKKCAIVAHPASVDKNLNTIENLLIQKNVNINSIIGPQHGFIGDKQDNMIESEDEIDVEKNIKIFSMYAKDKLKPRKEIIEYSDIFIFDLQEVGVRVYTYNTTLLYLMQSLENTSKKLIVLDRPNPIGRRADGFLLDDTLNSFVGCAPIPLQHGLTIGEMAKYFKKKFNLNIDLEIIKMSNYKQLLDKTPWPKNHLYWIPPSPNIPTVDIARCYPGTVLLEGTTLSEGRGTTMPLQMFGHPDLDIKRVLKQMEKSGLSELEGFKIRKCFFEPTYHKFKNQLCSGIQIIVEDKIYNPNKFRPILLLSLFFKSIKLVYPEFDLWRKPPYEYEYKKMPIDLIAGSKIYREWIDDNSQQNILQLKEIIDNNLNEWNQEYKKYFLY